MVKKGIKCFGGKWHGHVRKAECRLSPRWQYEAKLTKMHDVNVAATASVFWFLSDKKDVLDNNL